MQKRSTRRVFSSSSLRDLCLCKLVKELDHYSPEMLSLLPPVQRKRLLLLCPVVSICHLERTCAFDGIDSNRFWDDLLKHHNMYMTHYCHYDCNARKALLASYPSSREKYFTFLTAMIFSGDRFSGHYGIFRGVDRNFYEDSSPPRKERSCPRDIVNYLVAYRKRITNLRMRDTVLYYPLPSRDSFGRQHGKLYEEATKGQYVHSRYSRYISKENHYRLSDDDAVSLMMNECHFYPKKLFLHEYEYMHWKCSHDDLTRLLTPFFSKLELLSLEFRAEKVIDGYIRDLADNHSNEALELVVKCCFCSPVLCSFVMAEPSRKDDIVSQILSSTLVTNPCTSLRMLDVHCYGTNCRDKVCCLEPLAAIIASHSHLTEIRLRVGITYLEVPTSSFAALYTSFIDFVQREEFSKLTLQGQVPMSSQLRVLLDVFLRTPCSQPQEIHLHIMVPADNEATPVHSPEGDSKVPYGALEYKSLYIYEDNEITVDFCQWLLSHEPLVLKAFNFDDRNIMEYGEYGRLERSKTAFPIHLLSNNASFQTQELSLPMSIDIPNQALQNLLHHQQLTHLSLCTVYANPCNIDGVTEVLLCLKETLTELTITRKYNYHSIEPSANIERFGDALFSVRNFEMFSLHIGITWTKEDTSHIDGLYNSWLKHGRKKLKLFKMGVFECQFSLTDELASKLDKMGLVIKV